MIGLPVIIIALAVATPGPTGAQSFIYSYKETKNDPDTWHVCVGRLEDGKLTTTQAFAEKDVRLFYSFVGAAGDYVVLSRHGEGIAESVDIRTMKRRTVDPGFARAVSISDRHMVYLAEDPTSKSARPAMILKKHVFAEARSETICGHRVITRIPFPAVEDLRIPVDVFWGLFEVDGKQVIGKVDLSTGGFTRIAELGGSERVLSADVSDDGGMVVLGLEDTESFVPGTGVQAMAAQLRLVDTKSGQSSAIARSIYQAVPASSGLPPRFTAVFAGLDHLLYPETALDGKGGISLQRLVSLELSTRKTATIQMIEGGDRLVNAVPIRASDGLIEWAEYQIDPWTRTAAALDRHRGRPYRVDTTGRLVVGDTAIGYADRPAYVWSRGGVLAFVGKPDKESSSGLYVYSDGMEKPVRVNPDPSLVQTFGFLDTSQARTYN